MYVCVVEIQPIICCLNLNTIPTHTLSLSIDLSTTHDIIIIFSTLS